MKFIHVLGEALAGVLLDSLQKHDLSVHNVVGQGYDGGSNMRGAAKGVQERIRQLSPAAMFVHCHAHNLNRALVNAACDTANLEVRIFFGTNFLHLFKEVLLAMRIFWSSRRNSAQTPTHYT